MPDLMPRGIGGLIALATVIFGGVTLALGATMYVVVHETIEARLDNQIDAEANALLAAGHEDGLEGVAEAVSAREAKRSAGDLGYIVLGPDDRRVAGSLRAEPFDDDYYEFLEYEHADGRRGIAQAVNRPIPGGGRLIVAADRGPVLAMDRIIITGFAIAFGLFVLIGFVGASLFGRVIRQRLLRISDTAGAIIAGDFSRRIPVGGTTNDFDRLSGVINDMLDRIEHLLENLRKVSADIAHDIRSPLNRLRGRIEELQPRIDDAVAQEGLGAGMRDIDDVLELVGGVLAISELEGSAVRRRFVPVDVGQIARDVVDAYQPAIEAAAMRVEVAGQAGAVLGDAPLLRRCIANLLDNAIIYAGAGSMVRVSIEETASDVLLVVADDGPGVPAQDADRIFDRFVRLDSSRTKPGHGLGLNLVAAIAHAHMGSARVRPGTAGLVIEIRLPRPR